MIPYLNFVFAIVLFVLAVLWYREGHIAHLSLASQYSRAALACYGFLGIITSSKPAYEAAFGPMPPELAVTILPILAVSMRALIGITLLALVVTTARTRRDGRWHNKWLNDEPLG